MYIVMNENIAPHQVTAALSRYGLPECCVSVEDNTVVVEFDEEPSWYLLSLVEEEAAIHLVETMPEEVCHEAIDEMIERHERGLTWETDEHAAIIEARIEACRERCVSITARGDYVTAQVAASPRSNAFIYSITIGANHWHCNCDSFAKSPRRARGLKNPCKHLMFVARAAKAYLLKGGRNG
jgi:hypothetical protein